MTRLATFDDWSDVVAFVERKIGEINERLDDIVYEAFNVCIAHIQDRLGESHGDFASVYFTGEKEDQILSILKGYAQAQLNETHKSDQ